MIKLKLLYHFIVGVAQIFSGLNIMAMSVYGLLGFDWRAFCMSPAFLIAFSIVIFENTKTILYRIIGRK